MAVSEQRGIILRGKHAFATYSLGRSPTYLKHPYILSLDEEVLRPYGHYWERKWQCSIYSYHSSIITLWGETISLRSQSRTMNQSVFFSWLGRLSLVNRSYPLSH